MEPFSQLPNSEDIMREATKKLEKIKHERDIQSKFLSKYDSYQEHLDYFEKNLNKKIFEQKLQSSKIKEPTFIKIYSLLDKFSKLDAKKISELSKFFSIKKNSITQTDEIDKNNLINKLSSIEKENEQLTKEKNKLKNENEILKQENEELKIVNNRLNSQYVQLNLRIEQDTKNKKEIDAELNKLKYNNSILESKIKESNKIIDELKTKLKTYEEKTKFDLSQKQLNSKYSYFYKFNTENKITFINLIKLKQANNIFDYLDVNDIVKFRLCCKDIYKLFNERPQLLNRFYLNIIKQKNNVILKINKYDIQKNYLTKLPQLEQLIKIYSLEQKQPALGLRSSIDSSLYFLNKMVKAQLGIKPSRPRNVNNITMNNTQISNENSEKNNTAMDSFFGGVKSLFGFGKETNTNANTNTNNNIPNNKLNLNSTRTQLVTPNKLRSANNSLNVSPILRSGANSKESSFISTDNNKFDFAQSDELILTEINNTDYGLKSNYEFDYNSSDDINKYLNKFLKSPFPVDKLTEFITQLCINFCELLFNSYSALKEIHQMGIVNKTLNERFKYFYESNKKKEKIIKALNLEKNQNMNNINKTSIIREQRDLSEKMILDGNLNISKINDEESFDETEKKMNMNQMNLNISNKKAELYEKKYEEVKSIFMQYKEMTIKEKSDLQFQIELISQEKKELENKIKNLNNFFKELNKEQNNIIK